MQDNNFNLLRLFFACCVVFSHAFALLGYAEPVLFGRSLGNLSVHAFFAISGYLICQSYVRSPSVLIYSVNRCLRIFPGLLVAVFLTKYLAEYCGGFKSNPIPYIANGPVWTLTWEVVCYFGLAILGSLGALHVNAFSGFYASVWLAYLLNLSGASDAYLVIAPILLMFLGGASIALMDNRLGSVGAFGIALGALLLVFDAQVFRAIYSWMVAHIPFLWGPTVTAEQAGRVIYLAAFPIFIVVFGKNSRPAIKLKNDISYGVYIYGWPIAQTLVYVAELWKVRLTPGVYFLLTMLFVFPIAYLSWVFVERPCLALKKRFVI